MRRTAIVGVVATALAALVLPPGASAASKFRLGVAAGEVKPRSAKIWTRAPSAVRVTAQVATDRHFRDVAFRARLVPRRQNDRTVQVRARGLEPDRSYRYRFCSRRARTPRLAQTSDSAAVEFVRTCSATGKLRTPPAGSRARTISFAYTGDTDGTRLRGADEPFFGDFLAFRTMRRERNDFNIHFGDTIYSDSGVGNQPPALSTRAKWGKYRQNIKQRNLQRLRRAAGFYGHWDDHEFINDFSIPEDGRKLYRAGVRAFRDYQPVDYTRRDGLYRRFRWGKNLELFFLDQRSFRDAKASAGGTCDNPETGEPDLAPTAPPEKRALFAALIPSLSEPVSEQCIEAINDPDRTMLGERQRRRFLREAARSDARWIVIVNETPIQQFFGLPYDRWEGYAFERVKVLRRLEAMGVDNAVFITTDTHAVFTNVVRLRTFENEAAPPNAPPDAPANTIYQDAIAGPVATNTFWEEIDQVTGGEGNGRLLSQAFFKPPPPDGVGMSCAQGDQFSFGQVTVRRNRLRIDFKEEDGDPVIDVDGTPCPPVVLRR